MATNYGVTATPSYITSGLIFDIDPANPSCFTPGNTTCTNLVTSGNVSGAAGTPAAGAHVPNTAFFPVYNAAYGGVFDFAGGKGMNCDEDLGIPVDVTLEAWVYKNSTGGQYLYDGRNNGGSWFLTNYTGYNYNCHDTLRFNFNGPPYNASHPSFINKWNHVVLVSNASGSNIYINGTLNISTYNSSFVERLGVNFRIGTRYTTVSHWTGLMGPIRFYNRVLTGKEIAQNFVATRSRFGI